MEEELQLIRMELKVFLILVSLQLLCCSHVCPDITATDSETR